MKNSKFNYKKIIILLLIFSAFIFVNLFCFCYAASKKDAIESKIKQKNQQIKEKKKYLDIKRQQLRKLNSREDFLADQLASAQYRLNRVNKDIEHVKIQLDANKRVLEQVKQRLENLEQAEDQKELSLSTRIRDIYETRDVDYLSILLGSASFNDFLTRSEQLRDIINNEAAILKRIQNVQEEKNKQKARYEAVIKEKLALKHELYSKEKELTSIERQRKNLLWEVTQQRRSVQNYVVELEHSTRQLEAQLEQLIRERQRANIKNKVTSPYAASGKFSWPTSSKYITSPFGWRTHPIYGRVRFHSGIDIAAGYGAPIYAACDGVVIFSGWYGGYGYAMIIDHGGGYSTLYGHCSALYKKCGQRVARGQHIANIGSTGQSTGPHLHFEIRQNGTPINPRSKL
ncbi:MAG: peptidoglycan DD-metalloendopeptidase family protein [Armatimonadota bacterium]